MRTFEDLEVYDTGPGYGDRYTVFLPTFATEALSLNDDPEHPLLGVSEWATTIKGCHLGSRIAFTELPEQVRRHLRVRLADMVVE